MFLQSFMGTFKSGLRDIIFGLFLFVLLVNGLQVVHGVDGLLGRISPSAGGDLPATVPYSRQINRSARLHDVDAALIAAMVRQESAFNPYAVSHAGAEGLMQIMPATGRDLGLTSAYDPVANIEAGTRYMAWLLDYFEGDLILALAAYNGGVGRVGRCQCVPAGEPTLYVERVLGFYEEYTAVSLTNRSISLDIYGPVTPRLVNNGLHGDGQWVGRDFVTPAGTPLYAPFSATVARTGVDGFCGPHGCNNTFLLLESLDGRIQLMLLHGDYLVSAGQSLAKGQLIGLEASRGNSSGVHTHMSVRIDGELGDPINYLQWTER